MECIKRMSILSLLRSEIIKFNNARARMLDSFDNMTLELLKVYVHGFEHFT